MALLQQGGVKNLGRAYALIQGVHDRRQQKLGPEHIYTLWAARDLARTVSARGALTHDRVLIDEAKAIYTHGLEIATRNLGPDHIGTLMGRQSLADTLVAEKNYDAAEAMYKDVAERQKRVPGARAGSHRDRLWTLQQLCSCYEEQGRFEEALTTCRVVLREMDAMGAQNHQWRPKVIRKEEELVDRVSSSRSGVSP